MNVASTRWVWLAVALVAAVGCSSTDKEEEELLRELANLDKQTIYDRAETLYAEEEFEDARRYYSFVYDTFPNDPLGHKAALKVADTYAVKRDAVSLTEARLRYRDFANRYPNDPDRDYALLKLGQTFAANRMRPDRDLSTLEESLDAYNQLVSLYPDSRHAEMARTAIVELRQIMAEHEWQVATYYHRNLRWRAVVWRLEYLKQRYPDYARMDEVDALLATASDTVNATDEALAAYQDALAAAKPKGEDVDDVEQNE
jgi:outer membrane protein assembly factor BamD